MNTHHDDARQLLLKMSQLRGQIEEESGKAVSQARRAMDWKYQVASHPFVSAAVAVAVGYWLMPRQKTTNAGDSASEFWNTPENQAPPTGPQFGLGKTLAMAAGSVLVRRLASGVFARAFAKFGTPTEKHSNGHPAPGGEQNWPAVDEGT